jgi:hypothetical protein
MCASDAGPEFPFYGRREMSDYFLVCDTTQAKSMLCWYKRSVRYDEKKECTYVVTELCRTHAQVTCTLVTENSCILTIKAPSEKFNKVVNFDGNVCSKTNAAGEVDIMPSRRIVYGAHLHRAAGQLIVIALSSFVQPKGTLMPIPVPALPSSSVDDFLEMFPCMVWETGELLPLSLLFFLENTPVELETQSSTHHMEMAASPASARSAFSPPLAPSVSPPLFSLQPPLADETDWALLVECALSSAGAEAETATETDVDAGGIESRPGNPAVYDSAEDSGCDADYDSDTSHKGVWA